MKTAYICQTAQIQTLLSTPEMLHGRTDARRRLLGRVPPMCCGMQMTTEECPHGAHTCCGEAASPRLCVTLTHSQRCGEEELRHALVRVNARLIDARGLPGSQLSALRAAADRRPAPRAPPAVNPPHRANR